MGHHYIPRDYIRGFSKSGDTDNIWMYDKLGEEFRYLPIKSVAQRKNYYKPEVERLLAELIERPANRVIKGLRESIHTVSTDEKVILCNYLTVMMTRTPRYRERVEKAIPELIDSVFGSYERRLTELIQEGKRDPNLINARLTELKTLRTEFEVKLPKDVYDDVAQPRILPKVYSELMNMKWQLYKCYGDKLLVTSDNPVSYPEELGVKDLRSTVIFPISKDILLCIHHHDSIPDSCMSVNNDVFKLANLTTIAGSTRFVYSSYNEGWIHKYASKHI